MLNENIQEALTERLITRINELNYIVIKEIGDKIAKIGKLTPTEASKLIQTLKYGGDFDKIINKLNQITNLNVKDIYDIFEEYAKQNQYFAKQFYDYKGIKFIPYDQNVELQNQVKALAKITSNQYINFSLNTGFLIKDTTGKNIFASLRDTYNKTLDKALLSIYQGKDSYQTSMRKAMKDLTDSGIKTIDYASGYSRRLDSTVRMNMFDAMRNMSITMQQQFGDEFGSDGIEISVHTNSAPDHIDLQGHQFSNKEFDKLQNNLTAIDYKGKTFYPSINGKDRRSIGELNCYHTIFSIVLGVSKPEYTQEQLNEINSNNKNGFDYEGNHYTNYEGLQIQRQLETKIRGFKDNQIGARAMQDDEEAQKYQQMINIYSKKYKEFSDISKLPTQMDRLTVAKYRKIKVN